MVNTLPFLLIQCRPDGPVARDEAASIAELGHLKPGNTLEAHLMLDEPDFDPAQLDLKRLYSGVIISGSPYSALPDEGSQGADGHTRLALVSPSTPASSRLAVPEEASSAGLSTPTPDPAPSTPTPDPAPSTPTPGLAPAPVHADSEPAFPLEQTPAMDTQDLDVDAQSRPETQEEIAHLDRRVCALVRRVLEEQIPTLGLCYGLHHLALGAGGVLTTQTSEDIQAIDVTLTPEGRADPVTGQLDPVFSSYVGHLFSLENLPKGATLLGTGTDARYQLVRFGRNAYGSQFHPEISAEGIMLRVDAYGDSYFPKEHYDLVSQRVATANVEPSGHLITAFVQYFQRTRHVDLTSAHLTDTDVDLSADSISGHGDFLPESSADLASVHSAPSYEASPENFAQLTPQPEMVRPDASHQDSAQLDAHWPDQFEHEASPHEPAHQDRFAYAF